MNAAATAAQEAFTSWSDTSLMTRQQVMFKLQSIIRDNMVRSCVDINVRGSTDLYIRVWLG